MRSSAVCLLRGALPLAAMSVALLALPGWGQVSLRYAYDLSGNRVARVVADGGLSRRAARLPGHGGEVAVAPTVTDGDVTVTTTLDTGRTRLRYTLSDLQGRALACGGITGPRTAVPLDRRAPGVYLLTVVGDSITRTFKIVKK